MPEIGRINIKPAIECGLKQTKDKTTASIGLFQYFIFPLRGGLCVESQARKLSKNIKFSCWLLYAYEIKEGGIGGQEKDPKIF